MAAVNALVKPTRAIQRAAAFPVPRAVFMGRVSAARMYRDDAAAHALR